MGNHLHKIFGQVNNINSFDAIKISICSPEKIRSWSFGEVKRPETINYRTFKPERDGLFCAKIFGPVKDYECLCGKYKRMKYQGVVCEKCGVEVTVSKVRRERMGHIDLAAPVAHIWFTKSLPSRIAMILDITASDMEKVLYFESYIVTEPGVTPLHLGQMLSEDDYYRAQDMYGEDSFSVSIGAEALKIMLDALDLEAERDKMRQMLMTDIADMKRRRLVKRLKIIEAFISSGTKPSWMIMDCIPVLPPELRPLVPLDGGRFASSDLNDLYRRVINRNNRLKRLIELRAPDIIVRNEKRMLQEAVDVLFDNGRRGRAVTGMNRRPLKSLSDMLKGKQGRFRQNLLGKRVDYSGRSVIVVGPNLKLHQCGIPKRMALELFKPFVYSRLERYGFATTLKAAKRLVERERNEVWDVLEEVIMEHPVLLNRAPTLHRLSIQAFEPVLVEGKAIQLHPLVCTAFNADFDGDQMAVHVPLSVEAQLESRILMLASNNVLSPSNGRPIIMPTKDIVLGLYYLTIERTGEKGDGMRISSIAELEHALHSGELHLHAKIRARYNYIDENGQPASAIAETTPGRYILWQHVPKVAGMHFDVINKLLSSKEIGVLLDHIYSVCGVKKAVIFADKMKELGFHYATQSGISFGKDDLVIPEDKGRIIAKTASDVAEYEKQYMDGLITAYEKYNKVVDAWTSCADSVADSMMQGISKIEEGKPINSVYIMAHSGARGSVAQMRQVAGMRGLMAKPSGEIIETPIISNFKEGLTVLEYFTSTHGARKGMTDTALKTANSGYLTRRLVDVAQDCVITQVDCGTSRYITVRDTVGVGDSSSKMTERVVGRICVGDIVSPLDGSVLLRDGEMISERLVPVLEQHNVTEVRIRSVLTCEADDGVCVKCYGHDLSRGDEVSVGEAVGVIAAQSIGEPGTQLTMRTFHIGGTAQSSAELSSIEAGFSGKIVIKNRAIVTNSEGAKVVMARNSDLLIVDNLGREKISYKMPFGAKIYVDEGAEVEKGQKLVDWDPFTVPILAEVDGYIKFEDLYNGISLSEIMDESTGISTLVVSDWKQNARNADLKPRLSLINSNGEKVLLSNGQEARYFLFADSKLCVHDGDFVRCGDILARIARESTKTRDITGGLSRVSELFEARMPKEPAIMSEFDGVVEFGKDYKGKKRVVILSHDTHEPLAEYIIPRWRQLMVYEGDSVVRGDILVDGVVAAHDILNIMGVEAMADYLINEIQDVYRLQGVRINDKHIEVILRQMLRKVEITHPGSTAFVVGEQVDRCDIDEANAQVLRDGGEKARYRFVLQGITKASLQTKSFISAASFQETTRVLTEAAITGKVDALHGLKENVLVGRLIPAGTGFAMQRMRQLARAADQQAIREMKMSLPKQ